MINVSVIVCAQNPRADYIGLALEALRNQSLPKSQWELLLVDNASKESRASAWGISWHSNSRHIIEGGPGHASARKRGIREVTGKLLVFLDDDNILDPNYLSEAIRISHKWPRLGVLGSGANSLEFKAKPSEHLKQLVSIVARRNVQTPQCSNVLTCIEAAPLGAGLATSVNWQIRIGLMQP
jgi:glycosyltransferase involved in cell wall biosynthesis